MCKRKEKKCSNKFLQNCRTAYIIKLQKDGRGLITLKIKSKTAAVKKKVNRKSELQLWGLCVIPLMFVILFNYVPMFGLVIAFKKYKFARGIFGSDWCGFDNFKVFLSSRDFSKITWNTLYMNFLFIILGIIAAVIIALWMFHIKNRGTTKLCQTLLITPNFISWVIVSYMAFAFLNPSYGFVNRFLETLGMESKDWYSIPSAWPWILVICSIWKNVGMDSIIYYAALMGLDSSLLEAADIDGAKSYHKMWYIMIPELVPLLTILTIMKIGNIFRADFGLFYQIPRNVGALYQTTDVIDTYIFRTLRVQGDIGISSAAGLLQSVVGFAMVMVTNFIVKKIDPERSLF